MHVKHLISTFIPSALLIAILCPAVLYGNNYELLVKSGVSREVLDYEGDSADLTARGGTSLNLADSFNFNFTALRNIDTGSSSCTWNIAVKNISGSLDFISGNYSLHFGSGLMMGRPSYRSSDPFSKKISIAKDQSISPSNGGKPAVFPLRDRVRFS